MKPYYEENGITIYNCNYREVISEVLFGDLLLTDPPYGIDACSQTLGNGKKDFHRGDWDKEKGDILPLESFWLGRGRRMACIWGGNYYTRILPPSNDWLIWKKLEPGMSFGECELAWTNYGRQTRHIEHFWNEKKMHPTQKPLPVIKWALKQCPKTKGLIVDPFMGSGTTLCVAKDMGRPALGCEIEERYCEIAVRRLRQEVLLAELIKESLL